MRSLPILFATAFVCVAGVRAADSGQQVTVKDGLEIPGSNLKPGTYTFFVEDRLTDRAIVRIENSQEASEHYLLLAVPNPKLAAAAEDSLQYFKTGTDHTQALKAWKCAECTAALEFVYPKLEAVKITDQSTEPVLAVDPSYDKLPADLTVDDMKVVTLWLLAPERITADNVGQGVKAAKYSPEMDLASAASAAVATPATSATPATPAEPATPTTAAPATPAPPTEPAAPAAAAAPAEPATPAASVDAAAASSSAVQATAGHRRLPKTAGNTFLFALLGLACFGGAFVLRIGRLRKVEG